MNWTIAKEALPKPSSKIGERYFLVETLGGSYEVGQYFKALTSRFAAKDERQNRFVQYIIPGNYWQTIRDVVKWVEIK